MWAVYVRDIAPISDTQNTGIDPVNIVVFVIDRTIFKIFLYSYNFRLCFVIFTHEVICVRNLEEVK